MKLNGDFYMGGKLIRLIFSAVRAVDLDIISSQIQSDVLCVIERYGAGYGYVAYTAVSNRDYTDTTLKFAKLGNRAQMLVNDELQDIAYINESLTVNITA